MPRSPEEIEAINALAEHIYDSVIARRNMEVRRKCGRLMDRTVIIAGLSALLRQHPMIQMPHAQEI